MSRNVFNSVAVRKPSQNTFNLSHDVKLSCDMGRLIPTLIMDAIPGDVFNLSSEILVRFAPMIAPVMHSVNVHMHYFFVPNRLVWDGWEDFISPPTATSTPPAAPFVRYVGSGQGISERTLGDYLGLPTGNGIDTDISPIPHAGYHLIYNEYYRDQNLQTEHNFKLSNGDQGTTRRNELNVVHFRSWMHDYFTGALPFAQKGPAVGIPAFAGDQEFPIYHNAAGANTNTWDATVDGGPGTTTLSVDNRLSDQVGYDLYASTEGSQINYGTINDLRTAMRTQEFLERQARGGSRYIEQIRMQFGVKSSDARLQRPEYIGGISNPVIISEVLQTSETEQTPQGSMAGHAISGARGRRFRYYAEEHGYVFGIMSITPKTAYQQGVPRHFSRLDQFDYAWPVLAHIGEQEVLNKEIYARNDGLNDGTFGYVPRYSEYRYIPSRVAGQFRSSLNFWHMGRIFDTRPQLNGAFIQCVPTKRIFAFASLESDSMWCHVFNNVRARRKLPKYGTPTL